MNLIRLSRRASTLVLASLFGVGAAVVLSDPAHAGSTTANLSVTASVNANCTISTTAVAFGAYDPVVANASTALQRRNISAPQHQQPAWRDRDAA